MAHWCFQLLCILKTRMSWKSLCLLFFISTKTRFYWIEKKFEMGDVAAIKLLSLLLEFAMGMVNAALCCWEQLLLSSHIHWTLYHTISPTHYLPLLLRHNPFSPYFSQGILTSSPLISPSGHSVFLILTKINLLFSCWICSACKCCDSHIQ